MKTNFERVSEMNVAFSNPKGDPHNIDWKAIQAQCKNILDEFVELQKALGVDSPTMTALQELRRILSVAEYPSTANLKQVRDALCDVNVFSYGAHHLMGIDADRDMNSVVDGVMTRFIKDEEDEAATIKMHAAKGVTDVRLEGEYPVRVLKSCSDQPDAPKGKFLKSASFTEPVFYEP